MAPCGKGGSEGRIKRPLRAFKGAPAPLAPEVGLGEQIPCADGQRPEEPGCSPPRASVRPQFYGLFMQKPAFPTRPGTSNSSAPTHPDPSSSATLRPPATLIKPPGFPTRSSTPHSPQAAPPVEKETGWAGLPPGIMTGLQEGGGATPGQAPPHRKGGPPFPHTGLAPRISFQTELSQFSQRSRLGARKRTGAFTNPASP